MHSSLILITAFSAHLSALQFIICRYTLFEVQTKSSNSNQRSKIEQSYILRRNENAFLLQQKIRSHDDEFIIIE